MNKLGKELSGLKGLAHLGFGCVSVAVAIVGRQIFVAELGSHGEFQSSYALGGVFAVVKRRDAAINVLNCLFDGRFV